MFVAVVAGVAPRKSACWASAGPLENIEVGVWEQVGMEVVAASHSCVG